MIEIWLPNSISKGRHKVKVELIGMILVLRCMNVGFISIYAESIGGIIAMI